MTDEWTTETRITHYYRVGGHVIKGCGASMDQHRCGHPDEPCWTVTEARKVTPWRRVRADT